MKHSFSLPFPPSVNGLYAGKARRYKSPKYKAWIAEAGLKLNLQTPYHQTIEGECVVVINLVRPDKRQRDVANYEKAVSDLLVACGILKDDSLIIDNRQLWVDGDFECRIDIEEIEE